MDGNSIECSGNIMYLLNYQRKLNYVPESCFNGLFLGCKKLLKAPDLPATELSYLCYSGMFSGCSHLTEAPVLPATTLAQACYQRMFYGCTSLSYLKALFINNVTQYNLSNWLYGVSPTGTFVKNAEATWDNSEAGIPEGWTIEYATE